MTEWQPIEGAPKDEFILLYEDGMMRCGMWEGGKWEPAEFPVLIDKAGNRIVSRDLEQLRGERMELSWRIYEPTHWMPCPNRPPMDEKLEATLIGAMMVACLAGSLWYWIAS